jgi:hypothetical protein
MRFSDGKIDSRKNTACRKKTVARLDHIEDGIQEK